MKKFELIVYLSIGCCVSVLAQISPIDVTLKEIETEYNNGQYLSAELDARRMFELSGLNDSTKVQIEKWIAFSLIAQGKSASAKDRFVSLLTLDDMFELDPVLTSPKILAVFNDARTKFITNRRMAISDSARIIVPQQRQPQNAISFRTIVFPGWEQTHQGRESSGYVFLGAGGVTLASGIAFELLRSNARKEYLKAKITADILSKYDTYNSYRKAEIYSFAAFAAVYLASEIDVLMQADLTIQPVYSMKNGGQVLFSVRF